MFLTNAFRLPKILHLVDNEVISRISKGLMVLVGIGIGPARYQHLSIDHFFDCVNYPRKDDTNADITAITNKM